MRCAKVRKIGLWTGLIALASLGCLVSSCLDSGSPVRRSGATEAAEPEVADLLPPPDASEAWGAAIASASEAANLTQQSHTASDWDRVARHWAEAVQALQAVPPEHPQRLFAQRKLREYLDNLVVAQQQAERASASWELPTLGSPVLDEQVALYRSYVETLGAPDVLIIGSSRAQQGLDPQALQQALAIADYPEITVYNLGINGGTAQLVSFLLRQLLTLDELPKLVLWPGGSRAFNSSRFDRTFAALLESPGYAAVRSGQVSDESSGQVSGQSLRQSPLNADDEAIKRSPSVAPIAPMPLSGINAYGFLSVADQFNPTTYYQKFPRVLGRYDNAYRPFTLNGVQAVSFQATVQFLEIQEIPLIFINLPLSQDYLDAVRLGYERQFQQFLQEQQQTYKGLRVIDLLEQWQGQNQFFADPSHLNRYGATALAQQLAATGSLPWSTLINESSESAFETNSDVSPSESSDGETSESVD